VLLKVRALVTASQEGARYFTRQWSNAFKVW